ncbi:MAG: TatD family hydrolase [Sedimentisphaerales bacterium]|nr:TatD family hydrolase [Sedimentisphaerales bacterium]MBN2842074.1 TatD family hydrolase [Sedimentisphaerales bacterium]
MDLLTDIHCHLHEPDFESDLGEVIARAVENGIGRFVCNAGAIADFEQISTIAKQYSGIVPCFGIHPWYCNDLPVGWQGELAYWLVSHRAGVGEIGLDSWKQGIPPLEVQMHVFREQLALARELDRPAMIHCLKAYDVLYQILTDDGTPISGFLLHAYSGPWTMVGPLAALGGRFSFSHPCFAPDRKKAHKTIAVVPSDRLLLESDSPDLVGPEPYRPYSIRRSDGRFRNEPANISAITQVLAAIRGTSQSELMQQIKKNASEFLAPIV